MAAADTPDSTDASNAGLERLLEFIRDSRGFDFTGYKRTSLARRIQKRMAEVGLESWSDYRDRLEIDADEFRFLFDTILINVTSFFRDSEAWRDLREDVLPTLLSELDQKEEIRIWSGGCSTGEEPYSLAILLAETLGIDECIERVKIYGTDVDEDALRHARAGTYPAKALAHLPQELRDTYFEPSGVDVTFRPDLRRRVIFGRHDITRDAPISRLDLLVCRNTLMYFNVETQNQILDRLHFALKDGGVLFLGKAEMLLSDSRRFEVVNMRQRIFRRLAGQDSDRQPPPQLRLAPVAIQETRVAHRKRQLREHLVEAAPYAIIGLDNEGDIVSVSTEARNEFGIAVHDIGRPFRDHELSYRPVEVRSVIEQANTERRTIRLSGIERRASLGAESQYFDVIVQPLIGTDGMPLGTSISYLDTTLQTRLQYEVKRVREDLETAYEELQSTNEELETTNEELQSGNEELETMNEELRIRSGELDDTRGFLEGVLSSIGAAVVVLDTQMRVQAWNSAAEELWGLRASEVEGQDFFGLDFGLPVAEIRAAVEACGSEGAMTPRVLVPAINRRGKAFQCDVTCSPLDGGEGGIVILMEVAEVG